MSATVSSRSCLAGLLLAACAASVAGAEPGGWTAWGTETYALQAGESIQLRIDARQIPLRRWKLVVDGDQLLCDLHVLRMRDRSRVYAQNDESHHEVELPWGLGEEISISLTAKRRAGVFTLTMLGPAAGQADAVYSYGVNRALEAREAGDSAGAKRLIYKALKDDPTDTVARIVLAGMLSVEGDRETALAELDKALEIGLPEDMRPADRLEMTINLGSTLRKLGRNFQALELYQDALARVVNAVNEVEIKLLIVDLLLDMDNTAQAADVLASVRIRTMPVDLKIMAEKLQKRLEDKR